MSNRRAKAARRRARKLRRRRQTEVVTYQLVVPQWLIDEGLAVDPLPVEDEGGDT